MQFDEFWLGFPGCAASVSNSSSGSLHRSMPAPALPLAPTVGGSVVLTSKHCNHDAFIWEDKEMDLLYLQCAMQHMLVGNVLRETETHLVVRFDIPYRCLPPRLCGLRTKRFPAEGKGKGVVSSERSDECGDHDHGGPGKDGGDRVVEREGQDGGGDKSASNGDVASPRGAPEADGGGSPSSRPTRFVVGIVPVLALTHEAVLKSHSHSNARATRSPNEISESLQLNSSTTLSGGQLNETPNDVLHVSLSVTRNGCTSLLQNLLEQHDKLECLSVAVSNRDFKLAAQHIRAVIDAQQNLSNQQDDASKDMADSRPSSLTETQSNHQAPATDACRKTDGCVQEDRRGRLFMIKAAGTHEKARFHSPDERSSTRNEEEQPCLSSGDMGSAVNGKEGSSIVQAKADMIDLEFTGVSKLHKLQVRWNTGKAIKELAPLYALLSFVHFQDSQYEQCLDDAMTALAHDRTCIEAYTRVISGFMALGLEQQAVVAAAVAAKNCLALSPQFARLSRLAHVRFFYHRNLGEHSVVDVSPRLLHSSLAELGSVKDGAVPSKTNRHPRRPTTVRVRGLSNVVTTPVPFCCVPPPSLRSIVAGSSPPMDYFLRNLRVRAARGFERSETVFSEEVSLQVLLWSLPGAESGSSTKPVPGGDADIANPWMLCRARFCAYCGHPLVSKSVVLAGVRETTCRAMADRVRRNFSEKKSLPCLAGCGDHYCDEICRDRAALEYHWIECALLPGDESESEMESLPRDRAISGELTKTHDVFATLPSSGADTHASLLEILPYATLPLRRPDVRSLVNICRRLNTRKKRLEFTDVCIESRGQSLQYGCSVSSATEAMMEREKLYTSSLQACRSVLPDIRAVFDSYYASVRTAIVDKAPNAITAPLLVIARLVATILYLFMPAVVTRNDVAFRAKKKFTGLECKCRERSNAVKKIVARYASRGFTSAGASPSDRYDNHGLCLAEEVLQQIRVPFFADTNFLQPSTVWELLSEAPKVANAANTDDAPNATAATPQGIRRGFDRAVELLLAIDNIVQSRLRDEVVAFSLSKAPEPIQRLYSDGVSASGDSRVSKSQSDDATVESCSSGQSFARNPPFLMDMGTLAVWLVEEHSKIGFHVFHRPSVWTFGRLLGFLGKRRFMEQFWDFCVSSYCVVPKCLLTVGVGDSVPEHQQEGWKTICRQYTVLVAVMGPLTSLVTDLSAFGGDACSRFFKDTAPNGQRNPLQLRKGDSPATSMLSINSLPHESEEQHLRANSHNVGGNEHKASLHVDAPFSEVMSVGNLELCSNGAFNRLGGRCVTMRAQRPITPGEELCYEGD